MKKEFICNCVNPNFEELGVKDSNEFSDFIDNAKSITKKEFLDICYLEEETMKNLKRFPNDFQFKKNKGIYFFVHSCIEHFFK